MTVQVPRGITEVIEDFLKTEQAAALKDKVLGTIISGVEAAAEKDVGSADLVKQEIQNAAGLAISEVKSTISAKKSELGI